MAGTLMNHLDTLLTVKRDLHDGASYEVMAALPSITVLTVRDPSGDVVIPAFDRAQVRQLIEDLELVAGLQPTGPKIDLETALTGSIRILMRKIDDDLERVNPPAAARLRAMMFAHLRSKGTGPLDGGVL